MTYSVIYRRATAGCSLTAFSWTPARRSMLWCTTTCRQHLLLRSALRIGAGAITPSTTVRNLSIYWRQSQHAAARPTALLFCGNFVASDHQFHHPCFRRWSSPLCCPGWTTVKTLAGLPANLLNRLQSVPNTAARSVAGLRRSDHIADTVASFH